MQLIQRLSSLSRHLRITLIATAVLVVPQLGQFIAIRDINTAGHESDLALFFLLIAVFAVPTSVILSGAVIAGLVGKAREHSRVLALAGLNLLIALNITWFFLHQCSWAKVFGLALKTCS